MKQANCEKHSKQLCSECKYLDCCDRANVCDGDCDRCDIEYCENNPKKHKGAKQMKLTVNNIKTLRRDSDNKLFRHVCSWVIKRWSDYSDKTNIFKDVLYHGCVSGIVSELIWYSDTIRFYKKYQDEINELLKDLMYGTGLYSMKDLFGKNWDDEDPLAIEDYNRNLLAWFGFEETLRNIGQKFEPLQNYI